MRCLLLDLPRLHALRLLDYWLWVLRRGALLSLHVRLPLRPRQRLLLLLLLLLPAEALLQRWRSRGALRTRPRLPGLCWHLQCNSMLPEGLRPWLQSHGLHARRLRVHELLRLLLRGLLLHVLLLHVLLLRVLLLLLLMVLLLLKALQVLLLLLPLRLLRKLQLLLLRILGMKKMTFLLHVLIVGRLVGYTQVSARSIFQRYILGHRIESWRPGVSKMAGARKRDHAPCAPAADWKHYITALALALHARQRARLSAKLADCGLGGPHTCHAVGNARAAASTNRP